MKSIRTGGLCDNKLVVVLVESIGGCPWAADTEILYNRAIHCQKERFVVPQTKDFYVHVDVIEKTKCKVTLLSQLRNSPCINIQDATGENYMSMCP